MNDKIQPMNINISLKNIGIPPKFEYQKMLIYRIEDFIKRLRWFCFYIGPPFFNIVLFNKPPSQSTQNFDTQPRTQNDTQNESPEFQNRQRNGFKSETTPPAIKELIFFENELYKLVRSVKFRKVNNKFQNLIKETIKNIKSSKEIIVCLVVGCGNYIPN